MYLIVISEVGVGGLPKESTKFGNKYLEPLEGDDHLGEIKK